MKTANPVFAPPPPAQFSLFYQALNALILTALFLGAPNAEAQTAAHTFTLTGPATITETDS
ncbi:MAG: hypothetical protein OXE47_09970, partial [Gammaproteobacteria bacterium]|nr:hypothetical protein [Gammaproteobacteria bacterium]